MSDDHKYTFYGFNGPYFERKKQREAADELTRESEKLGLYDDDDICPVTPFDFDWKDHA